MRPIPIYVGYDPREAAAYHVFCQSVLQHATIPVAFIPLHSPMLSDFDGQRDGTNAFIFSRFLVPHLQNYNGWALFCDGDMVVRGDIRELWDMRDDRKGVMVAKHSYQTKSARKYVGSPLENDNVDYPKKNWSSVILWNCGFYPNRILHPTSVATMAPKDLHRFAWLDEERVGVIPTAWNWLVGEYADNPKAKLHHYTLGIPAFWNYRDCDGAQHWYDALLNALHVSGEPPSEMVRRAEFHDDHYEG